MAQMRKLILLTSISHMSFQLMVCFSTLSRLIHWPCLACETALAHLLDSSCRWISVTTISLCSCEAPLLPQGCLSQSQLDLNSDVSDVMNLMLKHSYINENTG